MFPPRCAAFRWFCRSAPSSGASRVGSCHVMPCDVVAVVLSSLLVSCQVLSCHVMAWPDMSRHVASCHFCSCHFMSCYLCSSRVMSCRVTTCRIRSSYVVSPVVSLALATRRKWHFVFDSLTCILLALLVYESLRFWCAFLSCHLFSSCFFSSHVISGHVLSCLGWSCPVMFCRVMSCLTSHEVERAGTCWNVVELCSSLAEATDRAASVCTSATKQSYRHTSSHLYVTDPPFGYSTICVVHSVLKFLDHPSSSFEALSNRFGTII